jgi:hypothetical protein
MLAYNEMAWGGGSHVGCIHLIYAMASRGQAWARSGKNVFKLRSAFLSQK